MALNYNFVNDVSGDVRAELKRREGYYWPETHVNDSALAWNYQKTAYLKLTS